MKPRTYQCWASLLLLFSLPVFVYTQAPGDPPRADLPGRNSVTGMIFTPDRNPVGRGILVRLSKGTNDFTVWTDQDGKFSILGVANGTYTLSVEAGDDFEPASERLEVAQARSAPPQTFYVNVQLRWRRDARHKPGVVDVDMARVPKDALEHYRAANAAATKGDHQVAVEELLKAVAEYPEFVLAHSELGVQYQKLNQLEKSDEHLRIALKLKPGTYEPLASLGIVLVRLKKHEEAESMLRQALKIKDDSAVVHFYLGRSLLGQKKPGDAEAEFRTALSMGGNEMIEARRSLANIYLQRGEDEKALFELEAYLATNPKPADEKQLRATVQQIKDSFKDKKP